jgi:nucleoside-diphosphate-sugar epimerase
MISKILVLGSTGFVGSNLLDFLKDKGVGLSRKENGCDAFSEANIKKIIKSKNIETVINCIGSFSNDFETDYINNILPTKNLLSVMQDTSVRAIFLGSSAEYGRPNSPVSENSYCLPVSTYGLVKLYQFKMVEYYVTKYGFKATYLRIFNLYGPGSNKSLVVGNLYDAINRGLSKINFGDLSAERDYLHISNFCEIVSQIINNWPTELLYNVGSGKPIKVRNLLKSIVKENNSDLRFNEQLKKDIGVDSIYADIKKINEVINV